MDRVIRLIRRSCFVLISIGAGCRLGGAGICRWSQPSNGSDHCRLRVLPPTSRKQSKTRDTESRSMTVGQPNSGFARTLPPRQGVTWSACIPSWRTANSLPSSTIPKAHPTIVARPSLPASTPCAINILPQDANHMGVSPNPDFLLAIPIAADANPADNLAFQPLVKLSAKTTGTPILRSSHWRRLEIQARCQSEGLTVFSVAIPASGSSAGETRHRGKGAGDAIISRFAGRRCKNLQDNFSSASKNTAAASLICCSLHHR